MKHCYIIVQQYTRQEHASPTDYITKLPMNNNLYDFGDSMRYPIFTDKQKALQVVEGLNEDNLYREFSVVEGELL